jgi:signal transduction histidine kinase
VSLLTIVRPVWRRRIDPGDVQRTERLLGIGRLLLAVTAFVALTLEPAAPARFAVTRFVLIGLYVLAAALALVLLDVRRASAARLGVVLHAIDIVWAVALILYTTGPNSAFFPVCAFSLVSAAYRWGFRATMATAVLLTATLVVEAALTSSLPTLELSYELNHLVLRCGSFMVVAAFVGLLAEREQRLRVESVTLSRVLESAQPDQGVTPAIAGTINELAAAFDMPVAIAVLREIATGRTFLWSRVDDQLQMSELDRGDQRRYFFALPENINAWLAVRRAPSRERVRSLALDDRGRPLAGVVPTVPVEFDARHPWCSQLCARVSGGDEWEGRLFLLDAVARPVSTHAAAMLQMLCLRASPALYRVYQVRRLRARIRALERSWFARELHENVVQGLVALQLQLETLRRRTADAEPWIPETIDRLQDALRQEVLGVRALMEHLRRPPAIAQPAVSSARVRSGPHP